MTESASARARANRTDGREPSKADLQRQLAQKRESLAETVGEIKDTVSNQYDTVKEAVVGVFDFREQFKEEPLIWSLGSLSAGFALGYTMGFAHKGKGKRKESQVSAFANSLIDELSVVGKSLVMPTLNLRIKELFGFDFSDLLDEIGSGKKVGPPGVRKKKRTKSIAGTGATARAKIRSRTNKRKTKPN